MPRQLPRALGAVDMAQASPVTALKTDNWKEGKGGEGKKEVARDTVSVLYSQAAKSLAALPRLPQSTKDRARALHQLRARPALQAASGSGRREVRPRAKDTGARPGCTRQSPGPWEARWPLQPHFRHLYNTTLA